MDIDRIAAQSQPYLLSLFRFITGLLFFHYGVAKLFKFPPVDMFSEVTPLSLWGVAGMFELVLGGLLMIGLFTRLAAFILSGEMAFAYFIEHLPHIFSRRQRRRTGDRAVLCVPVPRCRRRRPDQRGCDAAVTRRF